jgi:hypothetical protein
VPPPEAVADRGGRAAEARVLRLERVPQLVGMSVAARLLGAELSRQLAMDARAALDAAALREQLGCDEATAKVVAASLAAWILDRARGLAARCEARAEEWIGQAHRVEGRAEVLEELLDRAASLPRPGAAQAAE